MSYENILSLLAIFMVAFYVQSQQKNNWIVSFINLLCVSYMSFAIENEIMLQIMIFSINFVNSLFHIFNGYNAYRSQHK